MAEFQKVFSSNFCHGNFNRKNTFANSINIIYTFSASCSPTSWASQCFLLNARLKSWSGFLTSYSAGSISWPATTIAWGSRSWAIAIIAWAAFQRLRRTTLVTLWKWASTWSTRSSEYRKNRGVISLSSDRQINDHNEGFFVEPALFRMHAWWYIYTHASIY